MWKKQTGVICGQTSSNILLHCFVKQDIRRVNHKAAWMLQPSIYVGASKSGFHVGPLRRDQRVSRDEANFVHIWIKAQHFTESCGVRMLILASLN